MSETKQQEVKRMTVLEKIKKLDEDRAKLLGDAKAEAIGKIEAAISELNELGFSFQLVEGNGSPGGRTAPRKRAASTKEKFCDICKLAGHDSRSHRHQDPKKKFTAKELEERGLTPA